MKKFATYVLACMALVLAAGCTRISSGEVGLRQNMSNIIEGTELNEGSWNQTVMGSVLTFPVRGLALVVNDLRPVSSENTPIGDLDFTVLYSINPQSVSDLWVKKSRSFHTFDTKVGDWLLMNAYLSTVSNNAAQHVISQHEMLKLQKDRDTIEAQLLAAIRDSLKKEGFDTSVIVSSVRVQSLKPNQAILDAATNTIVAEQKLATALANTELAKQEALRQQALAQNSEKTIAYMDAESRRHIADAIAAGKVNTIILPQDFKGLVNVK